jgi:uncharacterized protein (TIGR00730 family)
MATHSVAVYCGSRFGNVALFKDHAAELGRLIANKGWRLVYGGGSVGLMGAVADAALSAGGEVIGVIPEGLMGLEVEHKGLQELMVTKDMHSRKAAMASMADAFLTLPGGIGTMEEFFEVITWKQLGFHQKPVMLLNSAGFFDGLLGLLQSMVSGGFVSSQTIDSLKVFQTPGEAVEWLSSQALNPELKG